ncbi:unnamed protein product, partial [Phaeothamnion confervicola]
MGGDVEKEGDEDGAGEEKANSSDEDVDEDDGTEESGSNDDEDSEESSGGSESRQSQPRKLNALMAAGKKVLRKGVNAAKKGATMAQRAAGKRPPDHKTEVWAIAACLRRCNCAFGVPSNNPSFVPVDEHRVLVNRDLLEIALRFGPPSGEQLALEERPWMPALPPPSVGVLDRVLSFLDARNVAHCARVCTAWHAECYAVTADDGMPVHTGYAAVHMTGGTPLCRLSCFDTRVDSLCSFRPPRGGAGYLLTAGQKKIAVWMRENDGSGSSEGRARDGGDSEAGSSRALSAWRMVHTAMRDTASLSRILAGNDGSMYCCSSNGSIKVYALAFDPRQICFRGQMWEHGAAVNDAALSAPAAGACRAHGIVGHVCFLYTASDDRTARVWDLVSLGCAAVLSPRPSRCGTLQSVTLSRFHLYMGSSGGQIFVYPLEPACARHDRHACRLRGAPLPFCLQETLRHGRDAVTAMACDSGGGSPGDQQRSSQTLVTALQDGSILAWRVPPGRGFGHHLLQQLRGPGPAVTELSATRRHFWAGSDGHEVRLWDTGTLEPQRVLRTGQRVKSFLVQPPP